MPKRILLIDSDESFAEGLATAADANGFEALTATNSERGMALAQKESPDLIVVCVEAQPTNGYMLCTRLKKDDRLKDIPVILTSANATADSFEKHKKLKTRAEDYLIKPFEARDMLQMASRLLGLPPPDGDEVMVSMDDESLGLGNGASGEDEPIQLGEAEAAQAHAPDDPVVELEELVEMDDAPAPVPTRGGGDADLDMFDQAFDALKPTGGTGSVPVEKPRLRVAPDPEPEERRREPTELSAPTDEQLLGLDEESVLAELDAVKPAPKPLPKVVRPPPARGGRGGAEKGVAELRQELEEKERQLTELQEQQGALEEQAQQLKDEGAKRDASAKALQQRADALAAAAKKFERELTAAREELKASGGKSQVARLEAELEKAREEIAALTGEKDLLREERDELRKQVAEVQGAAKQNEDRAVRAYQKMKGDEKLRERLRKALQIALALLEDGAVDTGSASEAEKKSA